MPTQATFRRLAPALVCFAVVAAPRPAFAVSKDMVQLQTQVQQLIDSMSRMQQSNDQQMGVLKDLVQQDVDAVNKMSTTVTALQTRLNTQSDAAGQRSEQVSGQVQALNDSVDELKARLQRMEKALADVQSQTQSTNQVLSNLPGAGSAPASSPAATTPTPSAGSTSAPTTGERVGTAPEAPAAAAPSGPAADAMYRAAYGDYMAGKYNLAHSEFADLVKAHPDDNLAGNALFYSGEISRRGNKLPAAIKDYDAVLERYPDNAKIPAAHLHKGEALLADKQTEAGVRELHALVQRFPNSPEAAQARTRLASLGGGTSRRR